MSQTNGGSDREPITPTPRWVKVFGMVAIILILLFVILHLTGNSPGGPGRHTPSGDSGGYTPFTEPGVRLS